jgi:hypothetical protein
MSNISNGWIGACHEAGHAVGAYILRFPLREVSIKGDGSGDGEFVPALTFGEVRKRGLWPQCAAIAELGRAVERSLFGEENPGCWEDDRDLINQAAEECFPEKSQKAQQKAFRRTAYRQAVELLQWPGFFEAVRAVAQELLTAKRLDSNRLTGIIQQALASHRDGAGRHPSSA